MNTVASLKGVQGRGFGPHRVTTPQRGDTQVKNCKFYRTELGLVRLTDDSKIVDEQAQGVTLQSV